MRGSHASQLPAISVTSSLEVAREAGGVGWTVGTKRFTELTPHSDPNSPASQTCIGAVRTGAVWRWREDQFKELYMVIAFSFGSIETLKAILTVGLSILVGI